MKKLLDFAYQWADYGIWGISVLSLAISLFMSISLGWVPCELCWYQRIVMYPIAIILSVALARKKVDKNMYHYILPMAIIGFLLASYHTLLQWGVIKEDALSCTASGVSCAKDYLNWFGGVVTIPFLALLSFAGILVLVGLKLKYKQ